jgi:glycosyltransferase involved in cell wall biosynthesis
MELSHENKVIAVVGNEGIIRERIVAHSIPYSTLTPSVRQLPLYSAYRLAQIIDLESVDIVHMHWNKDLPLASLAKRLSKRKPRLIVSRHMKMTRSKQDFYHRLLYKEMDLMLNVTRTLSLVAAKNLPPEDASKSDYLYLGVKAPDLFLGQEEILQRRRKLGITDGNFVVGVFGRIEEYKAQHLLIQAAARLKERGNNICLLIVGHAMDDKYLRSLHSMAEELHILDNVLFHDFVEKPQEWMQLCDCVTLTTIEETFGLVLVEAMRAGICVIGSNRGGVLEIIEHEKNGLLFESGQSTDLADKLEKLIKDRKLLSRLAKSGKKFSDHNFDQEHHFQNLQEKFTCCQQKINLAASNNGNR